MDFGVITPAVMGLGVVSISVGWVVTTWLRIKHGYPLDNAWGKSVYPKNTESEERVKLLTQENAQLRAELGSMKDRLGNVERIVTDSGYQLTHEIENLRADKTEAN
ncbi:hypothetical protein [Aurantiacibacter sp. D1-12]|uniref:hypothetical protein n=1 Tax=Aurantiacibacter sp. D1-12 TaxID=2993658 RepID=UPI00237CE4E7|nr:hypothetical protein [Aurantiacibacter sp. D1-12]MDE1466157.1 hypothetical protein [Aurantiacibacter sp. D1-12]